MNHYLKKLSERQSLNQEEMRSASRELLSDEITDSEVAAFLMGLKAKGENADEVAALVEVLREHALGIKKKFRTSWIIAELEETEPTALILVRPVLLCWREAA